VRWDDLGPYDIESGTRFTRCVFLQSDEAGRGLCTIHDTKPALCREYPAGSSRLCALFPFNAKPGKEGE
jgi:Fe-S-cluster containining protein